MIGDEPDILLMLIQHEKVIGELYDAFALTFSEQTGFWKSLAADEKNHADQLSGLRSNSSTATWLLYSSQLRAQALQTSIGYIESQIDRVRGGNFTLIQALSVAKDLESSLLERQFSRLRDTAPIEIRPVIKALADETERHLKRVVEALSSLRPKS